MANSARAQDTISFDLEPDAKLRVLRWRRFVEGDDRLWMGQAAIGYITHPLAAFESNPIWTEDPKHTPYRDTVKNMRWNGYAGDLGYASAAAMADCIVVNMFAEAASGQSSPKEAAERAHSRAERYYRV